MFRYYPAQYPAHNTLPGTEKHPLSNLVARYGPAKRLAAIAKMQEKGHLLDIGCATGAFLSHAKEQGWEVYGVEMIDSAASFCRDRLGLTVLSGDLLETDFPKDFFDVVTLWSVFEHLYDPMATLKEIRRILKPSGLLALALPNLNSLDARWFGKAWVGYDVPRHLYILTDEVLQAMLAQAGFKIIQRRSFFGSQLLFFQSLQFYLQDTRRWQWLDRVVERIKDSLLVRLLLAPYFRLVDAASRGPIITVFARQVAE
jgi:2-polyprenyl-3-methyl-5-hydroxy-6-metoxy-1,4-benzoquinol methylase